MKLLLHLPNAKDATAMYRGMPYKKLGHDVEVFNLKDGLPDYDLLYDKDVAIFQRPANQIELIAIEQCKKYRVPVIVDLDDNGWEVQDDNPAVEFYKRDAINASLRAICRAADVVTVSTEGLKTAVKENAGVDAVVIKNAIDETKFDVTLPKTHKRSKTILMRGAGSHGRDWEEYKDGILKILKNFPEYKLAVMGFHPEWLKDIPKSQIDYYKFTDIITYFDTLMQIRPKYAIVPLQKIKFNESKSAIAFYESAVAGALTMATNLPEFHGVENFNNSEELYDIFVAVEDIPDSFYYTLQMEQLKFVPKLWEENEKRKDILEQLVSKKLVYKVEEPKEVIPASDAEFHEYALSHGHTQDDLVYQKAHSETAAKLVELIRPRTAVEYGSGTGGTLVELLKRGVMARGLEINPYSVQYFKDHYPMYENQMHEVDFTKEPIELDEPADLLLSIEVFEHIDKPYEWWEKFIEDLSFKGRRMYFSSTPYKDRDDFDQWWSHINVRRTTEWIKLFEDNGWKYNSSPKLLTSWDLLFTSKNI